ncbi:MerR family DNA-binding transcriptional regulator [Spirillospora sp. CA-255316]
MMRIGEVARRAGVSTRALRYYEQQGLITAERDRNGYRMYGPGAVPLVRDIARLLRAGLASDDVRQFVHCLGGPGPALPDDCAATLTIFNERLATLDERISALTDLRERLRAETARLAGNASPLDLDQS